MSNEKKSNLLDVVKTIAATLQPILWWLIFIALQDTAKAHNAEEGLGFTCVISAMLVAACLIVPVVNNIE